MRKRWQANWPAIGVAAVVWLFAWVPVAALTKRGPHHDQASPWWVYVGLCAPYAAALVAASAWGLWCWLRSDTGWFVRRVVEPVTEDLRESSR